MFDTNISEITGFAIQAGKLAFGLVILLTIQVCIYRVKLIFLNKRKHYLKLKWRPFISNTICSGETLDIVNTHIHKRDFYYVLEEINYVFSAIRGKESDRLREACLALGFHDRLFKLLRSNNIRKKLYALISLGNIHAHQSWDEIENNLYHKQIIISLTAARSLVQIDAEKAITTILPIVLTRDDWPWANVAHILKMAGPDRVCKPLSEMIQTMPVSMQATFLRLFEIIRCEELSPITKLILDDTTDDKVASVCLHITQDPGILPQARKYANHERWHVRMHAATALGRFGGEPEIEILTLLLKDREWWVRYRSAQALASMPFLNIQNLEVIRDSINDKFAKDILNQVITEKR